MSNPATVESEQDAETYERLAGMLADGPVELIRLTDEELLAADPLPPEARISATPFLDRLETGDERDLARACGMRALVSRRVVIPADMDRLQQQVATAQTGGAEELDLDLRMVPDLDLALNLRAGVDKIVVVEQVTGDDLRDWHYFYAHGDRLCLQEAVAPAGQHTFTMVTPEQARRQLESLVDPLGAASGESRRRQVTTGQLTDAENGPLAEVLRNSRLVTQMLQLHPHAEPAHGRLSVAYLTGDSLWLVETDPDDTDSSTVRTLSPASLAELVTGILSA